MRVPSPHGSGRNGLDRNSLIHGLRAEDEQNGRPRWTSDSPGSLSWRSMLLVSCFMAVIGGSTALVVEQVRLHRAGSIAASADARSWIAGGAATAADAARPDTMADAAAADDGASPPVNMYDAWEQEEAKQRAAAASFAAEAPK